MKKGDRFGVDESTGIGVGTWPRRLLSTKMGLCPDAPPARESGLEEFNVTTSRSTLNHPRKTIGVPGSDQTPLSATA